jgi:phosphatidylglycerol---prolipoprotein diacylglyceryl transferase
MSSVALLMSAGTTVATTDLPFFHLGALDIGIPIQWFGMIVAAGVLIGATPLRRYAEWHGVSDENIRGLLTWIMISGFLGAHEFDVIAYQWQRIGETTMAQPASWWFLPSGAWPSNWPLVLRIWDGISSYGGFIGGAIGFSLFVWWKRLPARLFADITIIGLLPAFSIGRIGCTVVSDHIGAAVDPGRWYAFMAMDYPGEMIVHHAVPAGQIIPAWNLGLIELLYLIPVNALILWLAFNPARRRPAGFVTVLTGALYAPVRFGLDFLRPEDTDPRLAGLTFAQWSSILAFGVAAYAASRILKTGAVAETVAPTSREAQEKLRIILRDDEEVQQQQEADKKAEAERKKAAIEKARAEREREDAEAEAADAKAEVADAAERRKPLADDQADDRARDEADAGAKGAADAKATADAKGDSDAKGDADAKATAAAPKPVGSKPGGSKPGGGKPGGTNQNKNRKR